ncbi:hypothetical protein ACFQV2_33375 [Actinokineospora soli]|uniref:Uncharacterized protein n=1 Tax=Actinokineospora soli TaxID=1048753 RepID=A0ABW2TXE4_9PSEU
MPAVPHGTDITVDTVAAALIVVIVLFGALLVPAPCSRGGRGGRCRGRCGRGRAGGWPRRCWPSPRCSAAGSARAWRSRCAR